MHRRNFFAALGLAGPVAASKTKPEDAWLKTVLAQPARRLRGPARIAELIVRSHEEERELLAHLRPGQFVCMLLPEEGRVWGWRGIVIEHPALPLTPEGGEPMRMEWRLRGDCVEVEDWRRPRNMIGPNGVGVMLGPTWVRL